MVTDPISNLPIADISHWGYLIIFISTVLEAMPFGFAVPGHIFVIFSGFLVKIKVLNLFITVFIASVGATIGDWINFYLGRRFGYDLLQKLKSYFTFHEYALDKVKMLLGEHPAKTLIIGRFNPITRSLSPFLAGTMKMEIKKFYKFSLIGGFIWASASIGIGYIFGSGYELAAKYIGNVTFFALAILILAFATYKFLNRYERVLDRYHLLLIATNFFSVYIFFKMFEDIIRSEPITRFDLYVMDNISSLWHPLANKLMVITTVFLSPEFLLGMSIFILVWFLKRRNFRSFWLLSLATISGTLFGQLIKIVVGRVRPEHGLIGAASFSFPSAHALVSMIFFGAMIYLFKNKIRDNIWRSLFIAANVLFIILAGSSRIYLNVHRVSDVIAGYGLGLFCLTLIILLFDYFLKLPKK